MAEYYELINPSDPYIFKAKNHKIAALTVFVLGTNYGATSQSGDYEVPIFLFDGIKSAELWFKQEFSEDIYESLRENRLDVADALLSFMYGHFKDVKRYEAALKAIDDPEKKEKFIEEWQDGRSSLNDIGTYAHKVGKAIIEEVNDVKSTGI